MSDFFDIRLNEDYEWRMNRFHFHDSYEITIVFEGHGEMGIETKTFKMKKGVVILLGNSQIHRSKVDSNTVYKRYVIKFSSEYISNFSTSQTDLLKMFRLKIPCVALGERDLALVEELCARAMNGGNNYGDDLMCQNALIELLIMLNEVAPKSSNAEFFHSKNIDRVTPIMEYITKNYAKDINLDIIAKEFFITKQHLCYIFKKTTGLGINQYLTAQRIIKACKLLRDGEGVQLTGEKSGFKNNSHFIRTFKKFLGVSPGKYSTNHKDTIFV